VPSFLRLAFEVRDEGLERAQKKKGQKKKK